MKLSSVCLTAIVLIAAAIPAAAQQKPMDDAAIQRSRDIQSEVARIDANKEVVIDQLIQGWAPFVDPSYGDPSTELRPLMEKATPWTLYAASLVGDYTGMMQVLTGKLSAGKVINTLNAPQQKAFTGTALPPVLGAGTNQLVFTPIPPCRVVDTRGSGARTGILGGSYAPRTFDLTTDGFLKGQGGSTSCPGLPSFSFYGWSANITVTGYSSAGDLRAYPFGGAFPATSTINYSPAVGAIANSTTLTGCYGCADDVTVAAFAPTHVIIDVLGYFEVATGFSQGTVTSFAGTTTTVAAGVYAFVAGGACPAGTVVVSGSQQNSSSSSNTILTSDHAISGTEWYEYVKNTGSSAATVTVLTNCQEIL
jgi:hypothetical protein